MSDDDNMRRIAAANETVAAMTAHKLQTEMASAQVSLERSLRQSSLSAAVSLSVVHNYDDRAKVIEAAEQFLAWLRGNG
jgi:hypothetical protein